jgi:hypothetical protein
LRCLRFAALPHAILRRKHPTTSVVANLLPLEAQRSVRESQRDSVPEPRVERHELPWVTVGQTSPTATRLWPIHAIAHDLGHNAVGVDSISGRAPKVGVARQPWAGGPNPFGIVRRVRAAGIVQATSAERRAAGGDRPRSARGCGRRLGVSFANYSPISDRVLHGQFKRGAPQPVPTPFVRTLESGVSRLG